MINTKSLTAGLSKGVAIEGVVIVVGILVSRLFVQYVQPKVAGMIPGDYDDIVVAVGAVVVLGMIPYHRKDLLLGGMVNLVMVIIARSGILTPAST